MKKLLLIGACLLCYIAIGQTTAIPDVNFEQELIALGIDSNGQNGNILNSDAATATGLTINRNNITDFTGLQAFVNLDKLNLGRNQFTTLPLQNLAKLEELIFNENRVLASLDVSANTELKILNISSIATINPSTITTIDLSSNTKLEQINIFNFQDLEFYTFPQTNTLRSIRIKSNFDLTADLSLYNNLEDIDLAVVKDKFIFLTMPNEKLNLKRFRIERGEIADFRYLENYTNLEYIYVRTLTEQIRLPQTATLEQVVIIGHGIEIPLSFQAMPNLVNLDIRANTSDVPLQIDITANTELATLNLIDNKMNSVDVGFNTKLYYLNVSQNNLERLDLGANPILDKIVANSNLLNSIDLRSNTRLRTIELSDNRLTDLDITQNAILEELYIDINLFAGRGPDLSQNPELYNFDASFNKINFLDITNNLKLGYFNIAFNQFSGNQIVNQIHQNYQNSNRFLGPEIYVLNDNLLSEKLPDFTTLVNGSTQGFSIAIQNNNLHYGDIEEQHQQYVTYRNTARGSGTIFERYWYANQNKVNTIETLTTVAGQPITMTTIVRGSQNHYAWFKDGIPIAGAADSPEYTIANPDACESGVYHAEVTSDLVPLEDADAPGNNGKNLILLRNDISLGANGTPTCAVMINPLNNAIEVPINSGIEWESDSGACGYILNVGTTPGANDILADEDVGNLTAYNFQNNLPSNQQIYVRITPYFIDGTQLTCEEETFLTNDELKLPDCTTLLQPTSGSFAVPVFTNILWQAANGADGYKVKIGTQPGTGDLYDFDAGETTSFNPDDNFEEDQTVYVTITPYNTKGDAVNCAVENFSTASSGAFLSCTILTAPLDQSVNVDVNASLQWAAVANAVGYRLTVGTTEQGAEIYTGDVGSNTTFDFESALPPDQLIYVTVIPYDLSGDAQSCVTESFMTAPVIPKPDCTSLLFPEPGSREVNPSVNIAWNGAPRATGYVLEVGTSPGDYSLFSEDVGLRTSYNFPTPLPNGSPIYIRVVPYNDEGSPEDCQEQSFATSEPVIPSCTNLLVPLSGEENVSVSTNLSWDFVSSATGYILNVGTSEGNPDIFSEDVGAVTFYNLDDNLPESTTIYVTIVAYNDEGQSTGCFAETFTTDNASEIPECTQLLAPMNGETGVNVLSNFAWEAVDNSEGYLLQIGSSAGASDIFDGDVGAPNNFDFDGVLPEDSQIYVRITPYSAAGEAIACFEDVFTTGSPLALPPCATLTMPQNGATGVSIESNISWTSSSNTDGYVLNVGTASGASDIFTADVGRATWYNLPNDLPENSDIFVSIIAYNELGTAVDCLEEQFETTSEPSIPLCTNILIPTNQQVDVNITTNIAWGLVANADGYTLNVGTTSQGTDIFTGDVGTTTWFDLIENLPENTMIYVSIVPYNQLGVALNCVEESFQTAAAPTIPSCTILTFPVSGSQAVNPELTLTWNEITDVTGYLLYVGTMPGVYDILENVDMGIINQYEFVDGLPLGTDIFVEVRPYNELGINAACGIESFTTALMQLESVPFCTDIFEPINGQSNIAQTTTIKWNTVSNADGYYLTLGTGQGESDILAQFDVGAATEYEVSDLPVATEIYATVSAYNAQGAPEGCSYSTFITVFDEQNENATKFALTPNGDGLNDFWRIDGIDQYPNNVVRIFNRWGDEVFKVNNYNNLSNAFSGEANQMTGLGAGRLPTGTYFFDIRIEGDHTIDKLRGYLILKR